MCIRDRIRFDRKQRTLARYRNDPADLKSLSNNWVVSLFEDREGNIWAGTGGGGVNRFPRRAPPFTVYRNDVQSSKRINQNFVLATYGDSRGVLWVGNDKVLNLSLIHISEPTRLLSISYAVFCLKKKK